MPGKIAVLVVEDEPLIQMDAVDFLEDAGFKVFFAASAKEAIALLENFLEIRVLFTDIDMPGGMDGLELSRLARERWPPLHIIVTSGRRQARASDMPTRGVFIPKPYKHEAIVREINRMAA